jgi:Flp pilus assembly protein TadD
MNRLLSVAMFALGCLVSAGPAFAADAPGLQKPPATRKAPESRPQDKPHPLEALLAQADAAMERKDFAAAAVALRQFLAEKPDDAVAHFHLAYALTALGEREEARREYQRAIALKSDFAEAHLNLGRLELASDPSAAASHFARAAELMPAAAQPRFLWGLAAERTGQLEQAIARYREAATLDTKNFDIQFALARTLLAANQPAEAETAFRAALERQPDSAPARLGLAESLMAQGKLDAAATELTAYLTAEPGDHASRLELAAIYLDQNRCAEALAELDRVAAAGEASARLHRLRATALIGLRRMEEAIASLEQAVAVEPADAESHARLGRLYLGQRNFVSAERALRRALELDPQNNTALGDLASTYFLAERYEAALTVLDSLAQRGALPPGTWFIRAVCYDKLGRKEEALRAYEEFLKRDDGSNQRETFQARQRAHTLKRELERKR